MPGFRAFIDKRIELDKNKEFLRSKDGLLVLLGKQLNLTM
jgi:hypothetical protein